MYFIGEWSQYSWKLSRSEEHTSELQSQSNLVCRLLLEKKKQALRYVENLFTRRERNLTRVESAAPNGLVEVLIAWMMLLLVTATSLHIALNWQKVDATG